MKLYFKKYTNHVLELCKIKWLQMQKKEIAIDCIVLELCKIKWLQMLQPCFSLQYFVLELCKIKWLQMVKVIAWRVKIRIYRNNLLRQNLQDAEIKLIDALHIYLFQYFFNHIHWSALIKRIKITKIKLNDSNG